MGTLTLAGFLLTPEEWADEELRDLVLEAYGDGPLRALEPVGLERRDGDADAG
jgi:hypothetical protein